jgi:hypothetical protein
MTGEKRQFTQKILQSLLFFWIAERVQPGTTLCKPETSAGRTLAAPDYQEPRYRFFHSILFTFF